MADNGFGVSFLPNGDQRYQRPGDAPGGLGGQAPVQDPIKILSMRIPRVVGANPLAPLALLGPNGGGAGSLPAGLLEQLLRTLGAGPRMQADPGMSDPNALGVAGAPSPVARLSGLMPASFSGQPAVSVTAGATAPPPDVGAPPLPTSMQPPAPSGGPSPSNSQDYWDTARQMRESMGRIAY